jgi:ABC-type polar amino acid transport system ATPase subunit
LDVLLQLKSQGMTMVLATHEMQFARQAADKVCFLKNGKIIEEGPPDQIFEAPKQVETQNFLARALK